MSQPRKAEEAFKELEKFDADIQKEGLQLLVQQARLKAVEEEIYPEDVDEEEYDEMQ